MGIPLLIDPLIKNLEDNLAAVVSPSRGQEILDNFNELRTLVNKLTDLYVKAQIFY